jgi:ATP phosphoribosyltransferase regulatory subunit
MRLDPAALDDAALRVRAAFQRFSPTRLQAPTLQPVGPYLDFMGEGFRASIVEYPSASQSDLCLRPDYTLAIALEMAAGTINAGAYLYDDVVFRGDRIHSVEEAVHRQVGIELFGAHASADQDAAMIAAVLDAAAPHAVDLHVADLGLIHRLLEAMPLTDMRKAMLKRSFATEAGFARALGELSSQARAPSALEEALSLVSAARATEAVEEIFALAGFSAIGDRSAADIATRLRARAADAALRLSPAQAETLSRIAKVKGPIDSSLKTIEALAKDLGVTVRAETGQWRDLIKAVGDHGHDISNATFDANLGRGFSYYDGIVFEARDTRGDVLGGGGRYDGLMLRLSGGAMTMPANGAMMRPDRLASNA